MEVILLGSCLTYSMGHRIDGTCCVSLGGIAYAAEPCETVNYVSAHDNETLFDMCTLKMPRGLRSTEERIRASWLCTSLVALSSGIPFFHAGLHAVPVGVGKRSTHLMGSLSDGVTQRDLACGRR